MLRTATLFLIILAGLQFLFAKPVQKSDIGAIRQVEASARLPLNSLDTDSSHSYDMLELHLDYRVEDAPVPATGTASVTLRGLETQSVIPFNAELLSVSAVTENGSAVPFTQVNDTVYVQRFLAAGDTITLDFAVSAPVVGGNDDVGYHVAWQHVYSFAEPYGARRWYPCFDQPFDKFNRVTIAVNMPDYWSLASNGELMQTTYPDAGRKREVYELDHPIATYLVMICAGQFSKRYETVDGVEFRYFTLPGDSMKAVYDWERTPQMVTVLDGWFGNYPFQQYGMVQASLFNGWGAMEHETFTTYGNHLVDSLRSFEGIVAHELTHQWFGDAVGVVDFRNMWLSEGFATYGTALWNEATDGEAAYRSTMSDCARYYYTEDSTFRYAVYDPPPAYLFGSAVYFKGAFVLHMLREQLLGDSLFRVSMTSYKTQHQYGTVNTEDFITAANAAANQNLHWFFDQWIYQAGHPQLQVSISVGSPTPFDVSVSIVQQQTNAPIFRFPLNVDVQTQDGTITSRFWFNQQNQTVTESFGSPVLSAVQSDYQPLLYSESSSGVPSYPPGTAVHFELAPPYPNPFNASVRIPFDVDRAANLTLKLFDVMGRSVGTIARGNFVAGHHEITYDADRALASGVYFVALDGAGRQELRKIVLLK